MSRSGCTTRCRARPGRSCRSTPSRVGIYSCGPTVYGPAHIGNFRSFLFADLLVRHLRWRGYPVTWVMNITDIDDKIIRGAAAAGDDDRGSSPSAISSAFLADAAAAADDDARRPAAGDRAHRRRSSTSSRRCSSAATPTGPTTARSSSGSRRGRPTAGWPGSTPSSCGSGSGSRPTSTARTTSATSRCGRARSPASRRGRRAIGPGRPGWHIECSAMSMAPPRAVVRHPHRRRRPDLPAPRGRDRPERGGDRPAVRRDLAALRPPPDGRREDGQVDRQHRAGRRAARRRCLAAGPAATR